MSYANSCICYLQVWKHKHSTWLLLPQLAQSRILLFSLHPIRVLPARVQQSGTNFAEEIQQYPHLNIFPPPTTTATWKNPRRHVLSDLLRKYTTTTSPKTNYRHIPQTLNLHPSPSTRDLTTTPTTSITNRTKEGRNERLSD